MNVRYVSDVERVRAALAVIPADDYATWVDMAFALKQGFGEAGFDIWDEWSRTAHNYDARAARVTWRSASDAGGKTLASLFWLARQHGFDLKGSRVRGNRIGPPVRVPARALDGSAQHSAKISARRAAVAREAQNLWRWARPVAPDHPYLVRKHVQAVATLRELEAEELQVLLGYVPKCAAEPLRGRVLVVPVRIGEGLSTLELIDGDGRKSALAGGAKAGGYWTVSPDANRDVGSTPIVIAEGVATALSAWQATGWTVLAALSSGNLRQAALFWRGRYPDADMLILADLGAGYTHAYQAAREVSARLAEPRFASGARIGEQVPTDFDDMAVLSGSHVVGEVLREAIRGEPLRALPDARERNTQTDGGAVNVEGGDEMEPTKEGRANDLGETQPRPAPPRPNDGEAQAKPAQAASAATPPGPPADAPAVTQPESGLTHRQAGERLYELDAIPVEIKALAEHRFGSPIRMATPRENGGPYRGEVFNTEHYLIQEVAPRSVVFHAKAQMAFVSDRLRWMDENQRLNSADVQIGYDGDRPKVYPWDRVRDQLERTVASLKKSAREAGFGADLDATLDQLRASSWLRVKAARAAALAQAKSRADRMPAAEQER